MTDRPIIFSAPMVRALLAGHKTQTRRLASSPLRHCEPGDRLWVREAWCHTGVGVWTIAAARSAMSGGPIYQATGDGDAGVKWWPSIHMPREFSRITLIVEDVRLERLQAISEADAIAEGVERLPDGGWRDYSGRTPEALSAADSFATLWDSLHSAVGERWDDAPDIVALTFRVERSNIDRMAA